MADTPELMTVAACLIVKDGGDDIIRCLDSTIGLADRLVIIDTGSTDGTPKRLKAWAKKHNLPLDLGESEWVNFKVNRTELMQRARGQADWLLLLDDDMVLHIDEPFPAEPEADSYSGRIGPGVTFDYKLPILVRGDKPWFYEGVAHSYLACEEEFSEAVMPGLWVEDHSNTTVEKLRMDLELLSTDHAKNPLSARTVFYLAQTHFDLDQYDEAIHFYQLRSQMDGWGEETYYARYRLGCLLCERVSFLAGAQVLLQAWRDRPQRAEALRALAAATQNVADKIPYPNDLLFVSPQAYKPPPITPDKVSAVLVTRGNVDLEPVLAPIRAAGIEDIVVWDNSTRADRKIYGRYEALAECKNDVIFSIDDDVIFTAFDGLFAAYEPGLVVANMDAPWRQGAGYEQAGVCLVGAGALWDKNLPAVAFEKYLSEHPEDETFLLECDFVYGSLTPFKVVDLGYEVRPFSDDADRLYQQPGQTERKWEAIRRAKALVAS